MNKEEVSTVLERKTGYHVLKDSSLKSQTKDRLVWLVRILEHNWASAEVRLSQQAENVKDWGPMNEWISVKDRLPDLGDSVLLLSGLGWQCVARYDPKSEYPWDKGDEIFKMDVFTHWRPLPEPPKEESL